MLAMRILFCSCLCKVCRAYLCWRHTYCQWPIIKLAMNVSPKNKTATSHVVQIHTHARFLQSKTWPTYHVAVCCTNRKRSSFATKHFQRKSLKIFDLHPPPRRLVSFVAQINTWKVRCWVTDTHTQIHRPSTVTLAAHARRGLIIAVTYPHSKATTPCSLGTRLVLTLN